MESSTLEEQSTSAGRSVKKFEFRASSSISDAQLAPIREFHDAFAQKLTSKLAAYLNVDAEIVLKDTTQPSLEELKTSVGPPSCFLCLQVQPLSRLAALELDSPVACAALEVLLGGIPSAGVQRELSKLEIQILDSLFRLIVNELKLAWQSVQSVEFNLRAIETKPQVIETLSEPVVVSKFEMRIGEVQGSMNITIPASLVKQASQELGAEPTSEQDSGSPERQAYILRRIESGNVRLSVRIPSSGVALKEISALEPGNILVLGQSLPDPMLLDINGRTKFQGRMFGRNGRRAFELTCPASE